MQMKHARFMKNLEFVLNWFVKKDILAHVDTSDKADAIEKMNANICTDELIMLKMLVTLLKTLMKIQTWSKTGLRRARFKVMFSYWLPVLIEDWQC